MGAAPITPPKHRHAPSSYIWSCALDNDGLNPDTVQFLCEDLNLSHNNLVQVGERAFHPLTNLSALHLSFNGFRRIDAAWFKLYSGDLPRLATLRELRLPWNRIATIENGTFEPLAHLQRLDLSENRLLGIGAWLIASNQLTWLDLSYNGIAQLQPNSFERLRTLAFLSLGANGIVEIQYLAAHCEFDEVEDFADEEGACDILLRTVHFFTCLKAWT